MNCGAIRNNLPAYRTGDLDERDTVEVGSHLASCPSCMAEARDEQSRLSLLKSIDEITPSPRVWNRLDAEVRISAARPGRRPLSLALRITAAASILAAAFSFAFLAATLRPARVATIASAAPGSSLVPGGAIRTNEMFVTPTFALLSLPDVGTLKLNRDSAIVFESPRRVRLERGELFAEILPGVSGFVVESAGTRVTVHGTRFGVRRDPVSTVYVVDGRVEVTGPAGRYALVDRQMAAGGGPAQPLEDESLRWIAEGERPALALVAEPRTSRTLSKGDPLDLDVRFVTNSPAPVLLPPLDEFLARIQVKVTDANGKSYLARFGAAALQRSEFRTRGPNGPLRLDVSTPCALVLRVDPLVLQRAGRVRLAVTFQPGTARGGDYWDRDLESDSFEIEVR